MGGKWLGTCIHFTASFMMQFTFLADSHNDSEPTKRPPKTITEKLPLRERLGPMGMPPQFQVPPHMGPHGGGPPHMRPLRGFPGPHLPPQGGMGGPPHIRPLGPPGFPHHGPPPGITKSKLWYSMGAGIPTYQDFFNDIILLVLFVSRALVPRLAP